MNRILIAVTAWSLLSFAAASAAVQPSVTNAWSRPAVDMGVVYVTLANGSVRPDALVAAKSPVAAHVELHQSTSTSSPVSGMSGMNGMGNVTAMERVYRIAVPPHGRVMLAPGGYHIMLIGLKHPLKAGSTFPLALDFARGGWVTTRVTVRAIQ